MDVSTEREIFVRGGCQLLAQMPSEQYRKEAQKKRVSTMLAKIELALARIDNLRAAGKFPARLAQIEQSYRRLHGRILEASVMLAHPHSSAVLEDHHDDLESLLHHLDTEHEKYHEHAHHHDQDRHNLQHANLHALHAGHEHETARQRALNQSQKLAREVRRRKALKDHAARAAGFAEIK